MVSGSRGWRGSGCAYGVFEYARYALARRGRWDLVWSVTSRWMLDGVEVKRFAILESHVFRCLVVLSQSIAHLSLRAAYVLYI